MDKVDQWIALSDAGSGLEHFFDVHFPRAVKIVDFRHATEHLTPLAKLLATGEARWCWPVDRGLKGSHYRGLKWANASCRAKRIHIEVFGQTKSAHHRG